MLSKQQSYWLCYLSKMQQSYCKNNLYPASRVAKILAVGLTPGTPTTTPVMPAERVAEILAVDETAAMVPANQAAAILAEADIQENQVADILKAMRAKRVAEILAAKVETTAAERPAIPAN